MSEKARNTGKTRCLRERRGDRIFLSLTLLLAGFLLLQRLDDAYLWQDEAQTALISRTITERGLPYGTDGKNFFSQELGAEYGKNYIWKWHTWLPFYLVAGSFEIFGTTTFAARLPFALCGIGAIFFIYLCCLELWSDRRTARAASLLLVLSVPFLILSRQCRYYSLAALLALAALCFYIKLVKHERFATTGFVLCAAALFHALYLYCATLLASVVLHALIFHRAQIRRVALACACVAGLCFPWALWLAGMGYGERFGSRVFDPAYISLRVTGFFAEIHQHIFPTTLLLALVLLIFLATRKKDLLEKGWKGEWEAASLPLLFSVTTLFALCFFAPAPLFRYLAPILPVLLLLAARLVGLASRVHPALAVAVLILALLPNRLPSYLYEITHDYRGPIEALVTYLEEHASPQDSVAISYGDMPLKFYTNLRVVGGHTGEDLTPALSARWVIIRKHTISRKDRAVTTYLVKHLAGERFEQIELDTVDTPFENRESPADHRFRTATEGAPLIIYKRIP